jgi:ElaB/YqjD/DUF883 family membrane-anchored ribosome-binding protein
MNYDFGQKVDELRREAEILIADQQNPARKIRVRKAEASDAPDIDQGEPGDGFQEVIEDLECALNELSEMTEEKIAQHPIASIAAAFAIGVLIGRLTKS